MKTMVKAGVAVETGKDAKGKPIFGRNIPGSTPSGISMRVG